jgi:streptomycin 6-kinase
MTGPAIADVSKRVEDRVGSWQIAVDQRAETESSVLVFGQRGDQPVVLKVIKHPGDEWRSGEILDAFEGRGVVRVCDHVPGAILVERLSPGHSLTGLASGGSDDDATRVLAETIRAMAPRRAPPGMPTVQDWGMSFERYTTRGDAQIPAGLVSTASRVYADLCRSQRHVRLLHGDLHHENVLFDATRGWIAVDPKGVVGELEYEVGAALRNPYDRPDLFTNASTIQQRVDCFARELDLKAGRVLSWAFAQSVLAAIWVVEDDGRVERAGGWITLANVLETLCSDQ